MHRSENGFLQIFFLQDVDALTERLDMVNCVSDTLHCSSIRSLYLKPVSHTVVESVINTCSSHGSVLSGSSSHTLTNCSSAVFPKAQTTNGALHVCLRLSSSAKSSRYKK